jgi:hypothetical protein
MVAMPCRLLAASLRPTLVQAPPAGAGDLRNRLFSYTQLLLDKLGPLASARYLIVLFIGIVATIGWRSWDDSAGHAATSAAISHNQQQLNAILLDSLRRSIDQIAANVAALEEEMKRRDDRLGVDQEKLAASQEQMTRDITNLQALLSRNMEPSSWLAPAPAPTPVQRRSQASSEADTRAGWRRQPCCQWPISSSR